MKICTVEDDKGAVCNNEYSEDQHKQDGMCPRCAELIWDNFAKPIAQGIPTKPIIF